MKKYITSTLLALPFMIVAAQVPILPSDEVLSAPFGEHDKAAFFSPERVFYPETWFHYIGGNVSLPGITADLEAIAAAGLSGIQLFHGQFGGVWKGAEDSQITCLSPMWDHAVRHTAVECKRLGLRFTMQGCPGWAMAGGPWIEPENAMRHLVWSRTDADGGKISSRLPWPQPSDEEWRDYRDVAVLAFPTPEGDTGEPLQGSAVGSVACDWAGYLSGTAEEPLRLEPSAGTPYWIEVTYPSETLVRTMVLPPVQQMNHNFCYEPGVTVRMQAWKSDGTVVEALHVELPQASWQDDRPLTLSCREVRGARKYRITLENKHDMALQYVKLYSAARKNNWEAEAAWTLRSRVRSGDTIGYSKEAYVRPEQVLDVSDKFGADGVLQWTAPQGRWTILRIGHVNTGMKNAPAPPEGTGWECDKLSPKGSNAQYDGYLGRLANGVLAGGLLDGALFDSWECRTQTWTPDMEAEFEKRTGYPLRKWLPAVFGYVLDGPETTSRFLNDWRGTIGELFAENFFGNVASRAKQDGLGIQYETAAGDIFPADIMAYFKYADVPMCEFWQPFSQGYVGSLNFKPVKPTASAARMYGKPRVAAEAFTSFSHTWDENFQMLREVANVNSIEGVTHLVFHTYTHNPQVGFLQPGTSFSGRGIGTPFLRGQTWWKYMPEFTTYLARCSYMLERGKPVSDVLWYLGDEIDHKPGQEVDFPVGYKYDYCNHDVLINRLSVRDGKLATPEGVSYSVLWMPETARMLPETLEKLHELIQAGAKVVADAPKGLATLKRGAESEAALKRLADRIWTASGVRAMGKGCIVSGMTLPEALKALELPPDVMRTEALWSHRRVGGTDWYYVCSPKGGGFKGTLDFRTLGDVQLWNPVNGEIKAVPSRHDGGRTQVDLELPEAGSCFIVFNAGVHALEVKQGTAVSHIRIGGVWQLRFPEGWGAPASLPLADLKPWRMLDLSPEGKAFSGTVEYATTFEVGTLERDGRYVLDLGRVERMAEVYVNGGRAGVLWTPPYIVDISDHVKKGRNQLAVKVTNTWYNRLVYDSAQPEEARKTWVLKWPDKNAPLKDSGLMGPVSVTVFR